jgi:UDP-N-acetylglucosamine 2-epimerase
MRIFLVTSTRADFGLLRNLIFELKKNSHFDLNIMNWWAVNNVFGRILLTLLELSIIFSSLKMTEYDDREQNNIGGEDE